MRLKVLVVRRLTTDFAMERTSDVATMIAVWLPEPSRETGYGKFGAATASRLCSSRSSLKNSGCDERKRKK